MDNPLISIIVPVYNTEDYLDQCIKSIVDQTYKNLEIILVDDGSQDRCPEKCDDWAKTDTRIKVIHQANAGAAAAKNAALDVAQGDYLGFVDSDDYVAQDIFERLLLAVKAAGKKMSSCSYNRAMSNGEIYKIEMTQDNHVMDGQEAVTGLFYGQVNTGMWSKLFERGLFDGIRFPGGEINEEFPILIPLIVKANGLVSISDALYYYRVRQGSVTDTAFMSEKSSGLVHKNMEIIARQLEEFNLPCEHSYRFFVAWRSFCCALAMEKNYEKLSDKVREDYLVYRKLLRKNMHYWFISGRCRWKDKILCILVMTRLLRPLYKLFYREHL